MSATPPQPPITSPTSTISYPQTPTALIHTFLSSVAKKDTTTMRSLIHPNATAVLIRNNEPRFSSLEETIVKLERAQMQVVETVWDGVELVDVESSEESESEGGDRGGIGDGETGFATVWTKFRIDLDGKLHQLGSSSFSCWKKPGVGWVILSMADIAREQKVKE